MPKTSVHDELILLGEPAKLNEELVDDIDGEATPMGLVERLDDVKALEEVCFDPGGTGLSHGNLTVILPHGSLHSEANEEEEESIQIASEKAAAQEISYSVANHLFDKISDSSDCHDYQLLYQSRVFSDNYQNQDDSKILPTPGVRWLVNGAKTKVENSIVLSLTSQQILELHSYYSMSGGAHAYLVELLDFNNVKHNNSHSAEELTIMTNSLVTNEIFLSAYDLSFDDITCLGAFCFDPSGKELLCTSISLKWCCSGMNLSFVLKLINTHLLVTTGTSCFGRDELMQFVGLNPCYQLLFDPRGILLIQATFGSPTAMEKSPLTHIEIQATFEIDHILVYTIVVEATWPLVKIERLDDGELLWMFQGGISNLIGSLFKEICIEEVGSANFNHKEESSQLVVEDEPISAKGPSDLFAHQLLEEMPRSIVRQEVMFLDEIEKINDELEDRLDLKAPPMSSVEELHRSESFHEFQVSDMRDVTALSLSKPEFSCYDTFCFDHGGDLDGVLHGFYSFCLILVEMVNVASKLNLDRSNFGFESLIPTWDSLLMSIKLLLFDPGGELIFVLQIEGMPNGGEFVLVIHAARFEIIMNEARNKYKYKRAATWSVVTIYVQQVFLFGSFQAMGLCSQVMCDILTWLHGYKSKVSPVYELVGDLNLVNGKIFCYAISLLLDLPTQIRTCHLDAFRMINESSLVFVFDPGGHCSRLSAQAHRQIARRLQSRVELLMMLLLHLYGFATEFVILEDKDPLKRGVL